MRYEFWQKLLTTKHSALLSAFLAILDQSLFAISNVIVTIYVGKVFGIDSLGIHSINTALILFGIAIQNVFVIEPTVIHANKFSQVLQLSPSDVVRVVFVNFVRRFWPVLIPIAAVTLLCDYVVPSTVGRFAYSISLAFIAINVLLNGLRRILHVVRNRLTLIWLGVGQVLLAVAPFVITHYFAIATSPEDFLLFYSALCLAQLLVIASLVVKETKAVNNISDGRFDWAENIKYGAVMLWAAIAIPAQSQLFTIALGYTSGLEASGKLKILDTINAPLFQVLIGLSLYLLPALSSQRESYTTFKKMVKMHLYSNVLIAIAYGVLVQIFAVDLLNLFFDQVQISQVELAFYSITGILLAVSMSLNMAYKVLFAGQASSRIYLVPAVLASLVCVPMTSKFGLPGAICGIMMIQVLYLALLFRSGAMSKNHISG